MFLIIPISGKQGDNIILIYAIYRIEVGIWV